MRLLWPIVRKDVRHLWIYLVVLWPLLFAAAMGREGGGLDAESIGLAMVPVAATIACCVFLVALVHEEGLVGDRQYWLTRPLGWQRVLAAKAVTVLLTVCVPLVALQAAVFATNGVSPVRFAGDLFWKAALFTGCFVLPALALACVTRKLSQALLVALPAAGVIAILADSFEDWIRMVFATAVLVVGAAVVIGFQYQRREVVRSGAMLAAAVLVAIFGARYFPSTAAWPIQNTVSPRQLSPDALTISFDEGGKRPLWARQWPVALEIPVRIHGLPNGAQLLAFGKLRLAPDGTSATVMAIHDIVDQRGWLRLALPSRSAAAVLSSRVELSGNVEIAYFAHVATVAPDNMAALSAALPGACTTSGEGSISCVTPQPRASFVLLEQRRWIARTTETEDLLIWLNTAPIPYSPWPIALQRFERTPAGPTISLKGIAVYKPVAFVQRRIDLKGLRLGDFAE